MVDEKVFRTLLVVDYSFDYRPLFKNVRLLNGDAIVVEQTQWSSMAVSSSSSGECVVFMAKESEPWPFSNQGRDRVCSPDLLLIRNFPTAMNGNDYQQVLLGLMMARIPSINSLQSIFNGMFRPLCVGELAAAVQRIARRCITISSSVTIDSKISSLNWGSDTLAFPLHEANLTASMIPHDEDANKLPLKLVPMRFVQVDGCSPVADSLLTEALQLAEPPFVIKIGTANAGYGKIRARTSDDYDDVRSVVLMNRQYYTGMALATGRRSGAIPSATNSGFVEPLLRFRFEYRVQMIGAHVRVFKRNSSSSWKNNRGNISFEDMPLLPMHTLWMEEFAKMHGGLDITETEDGPVLLESNDSAGGFMYEHEKEDCQHVCELVVARLNNIFC